MITPVTFKSSYKVKAKGRNGEVQKKFCRFRDFSNAIVENNETCSQIQKFQLKNKYPYFYKGYVQLNVPNDMDNLVETYCTYHGIDFYKASKNL